MCKMLDKIEKRGYDDGKNEGKQEGYDLGKNEGYDICKNEVIEKMKKTGMSMEQINSILSA